MNSSLLGVVVLAATLGQAADPAPSADKVREAVQRSLPFIEKEGLGWIKERNCNSCHTVSFMLWSHQEALTHGVKVDTKEVRRMDHRSLNYSLAARQWFKLSDESIKQLKSDGIPEPTLTKLKSMLNKGFVTDAPPEFLNAITKALPNEELDPHKQMLVKRAMQGKTGEKNDGGSMAAMGQLLLGMAGSKHPRIEPFQKAAPALMARWQEANGSWKAAGQLPRQNRPGAENDDVVTGWNLLGLATLDQADPAVKKCLDAGLAYVKEIEGRCKSHEQTLDAPCWSSTSSASPPSTALLLKDILARRETPTAAGAGHPSAASLTALCLESGQTLYALSIAAGKSERTAIGRGQKYLLDSQTEEGHWAVPPKAITDQKSTEIRVQRLVPIYHFWGTAWAAIGLSRSLSAMP